MINCDTAGGDPVAANSWTVPYGSGNGQVIQINDLTLDKAGNLYLIDAGNYRVQKIGPDRKPLAVFGSKGSASGQFIQPSGIALDPSGNVFVVDWVNNRIQKFSKPTLTKPGLPLGSR
jgi:sugar lactone lactonase YvrE